MARPKKNTSGTVPATATVTTDPETTGVSQVGAVEGQNLTAENTMDADAQTGKASITPVTESGVQDGAGEGQTLPATDPEADGVKAPAATETVGEAGEAGGSAWPPATPPMIIGVDLASGPDVTVVSGPLVNADEASGDEVRQVFDTTIRGTMSVVVPTVVVKGPAKGRWRIGRKFTPEPTTINRDELSDAEVAALEADPELAVAFVYAPY